MIVNKIDNKDKLNNFLLSQPDNGGIFLQSWQWGEFQQGLGRQIWRLGFGKDNSEDLVSSALLIKNPLPLGKSYFCCPRGPIFSSSLAGEEKIKLWEIFINKVKGIAKEEGVIFLRFEPTKHFKHDSHSQRADKNSHSHRDPDFQRAGENPEVPHRSWCVGEPHLHREGENPHSRRDIEASKTMCPHCQVKMVKPVQPDNTLVLDLTKSEEELLAAMKHKTRYNIRLAERKGVKIRTSNDPKDMEEFYKLIEITYQRSKIKAHTKNYYQKQFETLNREGLAKLVIAEYKGKTLVANFMIFFGQTATYVHGASSNEYRNVMAPHLAQWVAVKAAKEHGFKIYDFWGIAPDDDPKHSWAGVTRFKKGFGGREINYPGTFDLTINQGWYNIYKLIRYFKI